MLAKELMKTLLLLITVFAVVTPVAVVEARVTVEVPSLAVVLAIFVTSFNCKRAMKSQLKNITHLG